MNFQIHLWPLLRLFLELPHELHDRHDYMQYIVLLIPFPSSPLILLLDILRDIEALLCCCWFFLFIKLLKRYIQQTYILLLGNYTLSIYGFQSVFFSLIYEKKCPTFELFSYNIMPLVLFAGALSFSLIFIRICLNYKALSILFLGKRNN